MSLSRRVSLEDEIEVTIRDRKWKIQFVDRRAMPRKTWGDCNRHKQVIRVRKDLSAINFLDTLIHELRHAQHDVMFEAEEFIDSTSTELAEILLQTRRIFVNHGRNNRNNRTSRKRV